MRTKLKRSGSLRHAPYVLIDLQANCWNARLIVVDTAARVWVNKGTQWALYPRFPRISRFLTIVSTVVHGEV